MKEKIIELRKKGFTYSEIQKIVKCSRASISKYCKEMPEHSLLVQNNTTQMFEKRKKASLSSWEGFTSYHFSFLNLMVQESISRKNMADALGINYYSVLNWCQANNFQRERTPDATPYERLKRRRKHLKLLAVAYKGGKCLDCNFNSCFAALEFHHRDPSQKDITPSKCKGWGSLKKEIEKCDMLCANCHRMRHYPEDKGLINP
jgi:hypothetical protein